MSERLSPGEYVEELRALREAITDITSRAEALDTEEKPRELAQDLNLDGLFSSSSEQRSGR